MERKDSRVEAAGCSGGGEAGVPSEQDQVQFIKGSREVMDSCFLAYGRVQLNSLISDFSMHKYHLEAGERR